MLSMSAIILFVAVYLVRLAVKQMKETNKELGRNTDAVETLSQHVGTERQEKKKSRLNRSYRA
jgi:hypothetical protein